MALVNFILELFQEDYRRNKMRIERKILRDQQNPFEMPDDHFIRTFRLSKNIATNVINIIEPHTKQTKRCTAIPLHLRVLATFHFLGHGSFQKAVGLSGWTCMSQSSISRSISEVCEMITVHLLDQCVKFPTTPEEKNYCKIGFYEKWGMRSIIGAIDGTHVEIIAPPVADVNHPPYVYINRKGKHSINVMLICNSEQTILGIDARYPGSTHDAAIFRTSDIRNHLMQDYIAGHRGSYLIGDSGYGVEPWLLTPFLVTAPNTPEERYNIIQKRSRNVIERTNGIWKRRFCCLSRHRVLIYHPSKAAYIIYACAVLHNMALKEKVPVLGGDEYEQEDDFGEDYGEINLNEIGNVGRQIRQNYIIDNIN